VIVYGRNPVREALRGPRRVQQVWATKNAAREPWLGSVRVTAASPEEIERRCGSDAHQGTCAQVSEYVYADPESLLATDDALILALDQVQDPQNLGAICRSAECAGVTGLVVPERRAASVTPAVCKASAGAVEHLRIALVRNLSDFLTAAKQRGAWVYGAAARGDTGYDAVDYRGPVVLVLGSEGKGVRPRVAATCDALVSIPLLGTIESLGVAAAAPVLLYAAVRSRAGGR
jgi:23S rRNA (guanosine2251-2'-O)-methyltransferase